MESPVWQNHKLFKFWAWCLLKATHQDIAVMVGYQEVCLKPGQFVFGRKRAAAETGLSEQTVRTCLDCLEKMENLTIKSTNKFSILTIEKWDFYQGEPGTNDSQSNQRLTSKQPEANQQVATNKHNNTITHKKNNYSVGFLSFWKAYPKKISKGDAWSAWKQNKKNMPELSVLLEAIEKQKQSAQWNKNGGQFIPGPGKWIRQCKWEDEIGPVQQPTSLRAFMESQE